jgi:heat shock protein HslJ
MKLRLMAVPTAVAVTLLLLAVAGCGASSESGRSLVGTDWRLKAWTLSSLDPNDFTITAAFSSDRISGDSGVNSYGGTYTAGPGDAFSVGALAQTQMAGPEPAMRAEAAYATLLSEAKSYALATSALTLYDKNGNVSLVFESAKP